MTWLRDTAANGSAGSVLKAERLACEDPNQRGLRDLTKKTLVSNRYRGASKTLYHNSSNCAPEKSLQCTQHYPDSIITIENPDSTERLNTGDQRNRDLNGEEKEARLAR